MELFSCREVCLSRQEVKQHPVGSARQRRLPGEEGAEARCQTWIKGLRTVGPCDFPVL